LDEEKWTYAGVCGSRKWCFCCTFAQFAAEAGKKAHHSCAPAREECNKYDLSECLLPVFDWSIIMIGPGGLLLVVPTYLQSPAFSFMCGGCRKVNN